MRKRLPYGGAFLWDYTPSDGFTPFHPLTLTKGGEAMSL